jgi:oxygen-independent coproporphyrinogen III oxidase
LSSLYIHIPYCKKICYYCDFHFSLNLKTKAAFVRALCNELELQKDFLPSRELQTIYFGGGTPSVLTIQEIKEIFATIKQHWQISPKAEITFEANPDDITKAYVHDLLSVGINRLSIGIQSFFDDELVALNRRHSGNHALRSVTLAQQAGFNNITIDMLYGIPNQTLERWKQNLETVSKLQVQHLSCYALTVEPQTALAQFVKRGNIRVQPDEAYIEHYNYLLSWAHEHEFEQYEISNFARGGLHSQHNSVYWSQQPYLGIGPSAHSYNGAVRFWNISHNQKYIDALLQHTCIQESEVLSNAERFHEYVMTVLRTTKGIEIVKIQQLITESDYALFESKISQFVARNDLQITPTHIKCTPQGFMVSDMIISDLFL